MSVDSGAVLSACGRYRYELWRHWAGGTAVVFVMLNPSTADAKTDDPTLRSCIRIAKHHGFSGVRVVNLFAWRGSSPDDLFGAKDPVGPEWNDRFGRDVLKGDLIVAAWGSSVWARERGPRVLKMLRDLLWFRRSPERLHHLGLSKCGQPKHPLYLRTDTPLQRWEAT